jgi:hypothetical protein
MIATPSGYRLAPAFDLVPDIVGRGEHTLSFRYQFGCPNEDDLLAIASEWEVSSATEILEQVTEAVMRFSTTARQLDVGGGEALDKTQADVRRRLQLINP